MANDAAHIAAAAFPAEEIRFGIAKQDVSEALIEFGEQAGLTVLVHQDVIGITSPGVDGEFGIVEALDSLLADTGLDYRMKGEAIIVSRPVGEITVPTPRAPLLRRLGAGFATALVAAGSAFAADDGDEPGTPADEQEEQEQSDADVETIIVTGSRIGLPPSQIASPVLILDAASLYETGEANLERALARVPQNFGGGTEIGGGRRLGVPFDITQFNGAENVFAASTVNLRGVGERGTLVLINGKRMGSSGLLGGYSDVSSIPLELVERVEIQLDGASAIYGSDAIGGVVNIILRKDYEGTTVRVRRTVPDGGGYERYNASVATNKAWSSGNVTGTVTYYRTTTESLGENSSLDDYFAPSGLYTVPATVRGVRNAPIGSLSALAGEDVFFASIPTGQDGTNLTVADFLATANNPTRSEQGPDSRTLSPSRGRAQFRVELNQDLPGGVTLSASADHTPNDASTRDASVNLFTRIPAANPFNPFGEAVDLFWSTPELPTLEIDGSNDRWRFTGDLDGSFGDFLPAWSWHVGLNHTWEDSESTTINDLDRQRLTAAASSGELNIFGESLAGSNRPGLVDSFVLPEQRFTTKNLDSGLEAYVKRDFDWLPAGKTSLLLGVSYRKTQLEYSHLRDPNARYVPVTLGAGLGILPSDTSAIGNEGVDLSGVDGAVLVNEGGELSSAMTVDSAFAELHSPVLAGLPLVHNLALTAAVRHEATSTYGSEATWSLGSVWDVTPDLRLRWRKGTSFSAPTLSQATLPTTVTPIFIFLDLRDGFRFVCLPFPPCGAYTVRGGKSSLVPETSVTSSYGIEYRPSFVEGLRTGVNYSEIDYRDKIDATTGLLAALIPYYLDIALDRFRYVYRFDEDGKFLGIDARANNIGTRFLANYDWFVDYERDTDLGRWGLALNGTIADRFEDRLSPSEDVAELVGVTYGVPKFRQYARLRWTRGNLRASLSLSHQQDASNSSTFQGDDGVTRDTWIEIHHPVTLDMTLGYALEDGIFGTFKGLQINVGASNLNNKQARRTETDVDSGQPIVRPAGIGLPLGRYDLRVFYVELMHTFR